MYGYVRLSIKGPATWVNEPRRRESTSGTSVPNRSSADSISNQMRALSATSRAYFLWSRDMVLTTLVQGNELFTGRLPNCLYSELGRLLTNHEQYAPGYRRGFDHMVSSNLS